MSRCSPGPNCFDILWTPNFRPTGTSGAGARGGSGVWAGCNGGGKDALEVDAAWDWSGQQLHQRISVEREMRLVDAFREEQGEEAVRRNGLRERNCPSDEIAESLAETRNFSE